MTTTGRRGRLFRREGDDFDDQGADLSEDEYAWWAAREEVAGVPRGPRHAAEVPPRPPESHFSRRWKAEPIFGEHLPPRPPPKTEPLFDATPPSPPPPPPADETVHDEPVDESVEEPVEPVDETVEEPVEPDLDVPGGIDLDSAHLVLQVDIGAEWEAITRAHRQLAKQFHPDRLVTYSPEAQDLGRARMAEINAAHATLRALHFH